MQQHISDIPSHQDGTAGVAQGYLSLLELSDDRYFDSQPGCQFFQLHLASVQPTTQDVKERNTPNAPLRI
jgi:hypothetical protein